MRSTNSTRRPKPNLSPGPRVFDGVSLSRIYGEMFDLDAIKKAGIKIAFDPMWGSARGYSDAFLREAAVTVATVHDTRDVLFGGHAPEPDDHLLEDLRHKMREIGAAIGIATDGDADRFGIVDEDGRSCSRTTSLRCSSTIWLKPGAGKTGSANPWPLPISLTRWPRSTGSNSTRRRWALNISAN